MQQILKTKQKLHFKNDIVKNQIQLYVFIYNKKTDRLLTTLKDVYEHMQPIKMLINELQESFIDFSSFSAKAEIVSLNFDNFIRDTSLRLNVFTSLDSV